MEGVIEFFTAPFPNHEREYAACMRLAAEHLASEGVADRLDPLPFNCFGFGLFAPGRSADPAAPYIGVFFDDPYPLYWVQIRASQGVHGEILACEQCFGVEEVVTTVRNFIPHLLELGAGAGQGFAPIYRGNPL